jgi:hypothetical protein
MIKMNEIIFIVVRLIWRRAAAILKDNIEPNILAGRADIFLPRSRQKIPHCAPSFRDYALLCGLAADCFFDCGSRDCWYVVVEPISPAQIQLRP